MKCRSVYLSSFMLFAVFPCLAQSQDPASGTSSSGTSSNATSSSAKPATPPTNAPANTAPEKKKPKKVWTNDEIGSVGGSISIVGDSNSSNSSENSTRKSVTSGSGNDQKQQMIENYRSQIQDAQAQIDAIDKRIAQLKNFKAEDGSPSGGINPYQGYNMVPLEDQVKQLEEKKKKLQAKIDDIESEAHKNGIDSGDLR